MQNFFSIVEEKRQVDTLITYFPYYRSLRNGDVWDHLENGNEYRRLTKIVVLSLKKQEENFYNLKLENFMILGKILENIAE